MGKFAEGVKAVLAWNIEVERGLARKISQGELKRGDVGSAIELDVSREQVEGLFRRLEGENACRRTTFGSEERKNTDIRADIEKNGIRSEKASNQRKLSRFKIAAGPDARGNGSFGDKSDGVTGDASGDGLVARHDIADGQHEFAAEASNIGRREDFANFADSLANGAPGQAG